MRGMDAGSVDAIVTSPPYADQRTYNPGEIGGRDKRAGAVNAHHRARSRRERSSAPDRWVEFMEPFTEEMLRVLSPTGSLMLNLGVVLRDGEEHPCTDQIIAQARAQGFKLIHRLIWNKPNGQVPSAPGYLTVAHEFVAWLAPSVDCWRAFTEPAGSQASREVRTPHAPSSVSRMKALYTGAGTHRKQSSVHKLHPDGARPTTVITAAVGVDANPEKHPARMAMKVARDCVAMICPPGGLVLDPFCGNATTGVAAEGLGRRFLGVEIREDFAEGARRRMRKDVQIVHDDVVIAEQLGLAL
jgi:site-specific DNA-methyltransferase (cytosine-N4-specific)